MDLNSTISSSRSAIRLASSALVTVLALSVTASCSYVDPNNPGSAVTSDVQPGPPEDSASTVTPSTTWSGLDGAGLIVASCSQPEGIGSVNISISRLDPASGEQLGVMRLPSTFQDPTAGVLVGAFSCTTPFVPAFTQDFAYEIVQQPPSLNSNDRHLGLIDTRTLAFTDITALSAAEDGSTVSTYDDQPRIEGNLLRWTRNRSEVWEYDLRTGAASRTDATPDLKVHTTDEYSPTTPDGTVAASTACPLDTSEPGCDSDGRFGSDGDLFVFPVGATDDTDVQGIWLEAEGVRLQYAQATVWLDDTRLIVTSGGVPYLVDVSGYTSGQVEETPPTLAAQPILPRTGQPDLDLSPSPSGDEIAYLTVDEYNNASGHIIASDGGDPIPLDISAALAEGALSTRLLRWV